MICSARWETQALEEVASEDHARCALQTSVVLLVRVSGGRCLGLNPDTCYQLRGLGQASYLTGRGLEGGAVWRVDG